jgi:hypothetical protein
MYTVPRARAQQERRRPRRPERHRVKDLQGEEPEGAGAVAVAAVDSPVVGRRSRLHPAPRI